MSFRTVSTWAIKNPTPSLVLFLGLMLAGLISFARLDVNDSPEVDFPAVRIVVAQPGAAPTEMENQVTQRIEAAVRNINGVNTIQSFVNEGNSSTFVEFTIGTIAPSTMSAMRWPRSAAICRMAFWNPKCCASRSTVAGRSLILRSKMLT